MLIYLPIAEVSVNAFLLLGLGGLVGVLSGMFGVGGGFLMTPLLFFIGIPPAVAVATEANQIVASSFSSLAMSSSSSLAMPFVSLVFSFLPSDSFAFLDALCSSALLSLSLSLIHI